MVLVDTSIWVRHLRSGESHLVELLDVAAVAIHPFVIGELACGRLNQRDEVLTLLRALPGAEMLQNEEVLPFIEKRGLMGRGIGLVDVHLLASAILSGIPLWTSDKSLQEAARGLGVDYEASDRS